MKQQIKAFQDTLDAFQDYSKLLAAAAAALRAGDRSEDLIVSLMRDQENVLPSDIVERLLKGAQSAAESVPFLKALLAKPDVLQSILSTLTHSRSLDRELEMTLNLQSPEFARVPPPYRFFKPSVNEIDTAFPSEIDGPLRTPEIIAFQRYLETVENPWRK